MNKKQILVAVLATLTLASCGDSGKTTFYGQTFTFQNDACCSINYASSGQSLGDLIKENFASNINWDKTGFYNSGFLVSEIIPFTSHNTYDDMYNGMISEAKTNFAKVYSDLKVVMGDYSAKTASISYKGETKSYTVKPYGEDTEDASTLYFYDGDNSVGQISFPLLNGMGCHNGKWDCVEIEYDGTYSRSQCIVTFNNKVTWHNEETSYVTWYVYAKIAN